MRNGTPGSAAGSSCSRTREIRRHVRTHRAVPCAVTRFIATADLRRAVRQWCEHDDARRESERRIQQTIVADGVEHPISDTECRGTQRAEWSADGRKLYSGQISPARATKAIAECRAFRFSAPMARGLTYRRSTSAGSRPCACVITGACRRSTRIGNGLTHASPLTLDDVKEAAAKVSARTLEAALVETGSSFDLSGKDLLSLQDAKVPGSVTDLIVALSYPKRFVVERTAHADTTPMAPLVDDPFFVGWAFGYPMWSDFGFYSPLYGPYSPYFYSPFYSYLPWYYPRYVRQYLHVASVTAPDRAEEAASVANRDRSGAGRAVDGLGYTRVRPREAEPTAAVRRGHHPGRWLLQVDRLRRGPSSSGGGGGSVSSSGFSSGGSGGDGGRTAQPR